MSDINKKEELHAKDVLENAGHGSEDNIETKKNESKVKKGKNGFVKEFVDYIEIFAVAICSVVLIFTFFLRVCTVDGASMNNTLHHGENIIISDMFYTPKRNDVIVFYESNALNRPVVKRVIATEGETVEISYFDDTMIVEITSVDGKTTVLKENYILYDYQKFFSDEIYVVPENHVFVMGDNRNDSRDSRDPSVGFVDERAILGKVIFRIMPFSAAGSIK